VPTRRALFGCLAALPLALLPALARAQAEFPTRTITIVVPFPAGGTADMLARQVAEKLRAKFGQPVIVENRQGAGGNVGAEYVSRAAPDGYTLLCAPQLNYSVQHLLYPKLNYDPRAFEPVSVLAQYPNILLGRADLPASSLADLVAYARSNPAKLNYASQGVGQIGHLTLELFKQMGKLDIVHVPYRGSAPAITAILGSQIDLLADNLLANIQNIQAGKMKFLAVGSAQRLKAFPDVPAVAEVLPGFISDTWMAIAAPPGTPKAITATLSAAIAEGIRSPDVTARITELYAEPFGSTPEQMAELIRQSAQRWEPVVTAGKITAE
jgi:tripartite-type tricarboxylate transporter receptor subunit TctC